MTVLESPLIVEARYLCRGARAPRWRTMREFAEQEVVIPDGPHAGRRYRVDRQPYTGLWFSEVDSGRWSRVFTTGPTQSGKSLTSYVIPTMFHLFELNETVINGVPNLDMVSDKWREDLLPAIEASRYRDLLPRVGRGSKGGTPTAIRFRHGVTLRFMTGGGGDKSRAGFTSRVLVVTETDGFDKQGGSSREADQLTQLEARTRAYGSRRRLYAECTVTTEDGRTWREIKSGTDSRILLPCPYCGEYVAPERDQLQGWQAATDVIGARRAAHFVCPECNKPWTEDDRINANRAATLEHRGNQDTDTLGFRWSAVNNLFMTAGDYGADEWTGRADPNEDNAERKMCQFVWAIPFTPKGGNALTLDVATIVHRVTKEPKGRVPAGSVALTVGVDVGQYLCHWAAIAWRRDGGGQVIDYGRQEVASKEMGIERALLLALRHFRDVVCEAGWPMAEGGSMRPDSVMVDAGWQGQRADSFPVYQFASESPRNYRASMGFGVGQIAGGWKARNNVVAGDNYQVAAMQRGGLRVELVEVNVDHWKTWLHGHLMQPPTRPGAILLHAGTENDHIAYAKHLTAERQAEEFVPGKGPVVKWERINRNNHWLDATVLAAVGGHLAGIRQTTTTQVAADRPKPTTAPRPVLTMPDGRAFLVTDRS